MLHWHLLAWSFILSPLWHRDTLDSLGLGNPRRAFRLLRESRGWRRWALLSTMVILFAALMAIGLSHWPETARMFKMPGSIRGWNHEPGGMGKMVAFCAVMSALIVWWVVRWDNLATALRKVLAVAGVLVAYMGVAAVLNHGTAAFERFEWRRFPLDVLARIRAGEVSSSFVSLATSRERLRRRRSSG